MDDISHFLVQLLSS